MKSSVIVDGMNVIGSRPTGWWRDRRKAMRELVRELDHWAAASGARPTVVFDSAPFDIGESGSVRVMFAARRGRGAADDTIVELVSEASDPGSLEVVTSDRELAARASERGAHVTSSGELRRMLDETDQPIL